MRNSHIGGRFGLAAWLLACSWTVAPAVVQAEDIVTDRPDFTESAVVVPRGMVQIEAGFTWTDPGDPQPPVPPEEGEEPPPPLGERSDDFKEFTTAPEVLIRWGFADNLELRVGLPNQIEISDGPSGVGDGSVGVKWQLGPNRFGLDYALIAGVSVPIGDSEFTSDGVDPSLIFIVGDDINGKWSYGAQVGGGVATGGSEDEAFVLASFAFARQLGRRGSTFFEFFGEDQESTPSSVLFHHGYAWQVNSNFQLDLRMGVGLTDESPDGLFGAGVSWRW